MINQHDDGHGIQRFLSRWQEGANAARAGKQSTDCPYLRETYHFVTWTNGWATAAHEMAKEDDGEL